MPSHHITTTTNIKIPYPLSWRGYGITNVRIEGVSWNSLTLEIGSSYTHETILPYMGNVLFLTRDGEVIPFVAFHSFVLIINATDATVSYDIVPVRHIPSTRIVHLPFQLKLPISSTKIVYISTWTCQLTVITEEEPTLLIPPQLKIKCQKQTENSKEWIFDFVSPHVEEKVPIYIPIQISVKDPSHTIIVWGIEQNILRCISDMYGLSFS